MSNIVWSPTKGWHDGPEVEVTPRLRRPNARALAAMHKVATAAAQAAANGHCQRCGAIEVRLSNVVGHTDLRCIGEDAAYPVGYGCELCD